MFSLYLEGRGTNKFLKKCGSIKCKSTSNSLASKNKLRFLFFVLYVENPDDRFNLYMKYSELYPRAQAPKRIPLSFTSGMEYVYMCIIPRNKSFMHGTFEAYFQPPLR